MYCETFTSDLLAKDMSGDARTAFSRWAEWKVGDQLPKASDVWASVTEDQAAYWILLRPVGEEEFAYEFFGHGVADAFKVDMLGKTTRDLEPDVRGVLNSLYASVVRSRQPALAIHRASYALEVHLWERLVLPVLSADGGLRLLVVARPRAMVRDLLNAVMDASPVGIAAFQAIHADDGEIVDATITTVNRACESFLGRDAQDMVNKRLLVLFPGIIQSGAWERYRKTMIERVSDDFSYYATPAGRWLNVKIAPLGDGFIMVLTDVSVLQNALIEVEREKQNAQRLLSELKNEIAQRELLESNLRRISSTDELTGVLNRRGFDEVVGLKVKEILERREAATVVVVDIDRFKYVNDQFGHAGGDVVLRTIGGVLAQNIRAGDVLGRMGGEEFMILLRGTPLERAWETAERLRMIVATTPIQYESVTIVVTASFGVQEIALAGSLEKARLEADRALYAAKEAGRNCVRAYGVDLDPLRDIAWYGRPGDATETAFVD